MDRIVRQAIHQVHCPKQSSEFSDGFRPKRNGEMAIIKSMEFLDDGHNWVKEHM
ncbi:MAG: hypothetical protein ABF649_10055 [Bacillus sp. (in: firmicutes)]